MKCSVLSCNSYSMSKTPGISFHSFPNDPELRNLWIAFTERINWAPKPSSRMCSLHFTSNLLKKKGHMTFLDHDAVPYKLTSLESTSYITSIKMEKSETCQADATKIISVSPDSSPRTLHMKLMNTQKISQIRLKKLNALREKRRRLTKKVADLETVLAKIKCKPFLKKTVYLTSTNTTNKDSMKNV